MKLSNAAPSSLHHRGLIRSACTLTIVISIFSTNNEVHAYGFDQDLQFTLNNAAVTDESFLDVTKAPYNLKNNGTNAGANTTQLQNAIDDAYNHNLAVFFPAGTYLVNNQFELFQIEEHMTHVHVLVGSAAGARPVIQLTGSNFNNSSNPKALFFYYCSPNGSGPPAADRALSGYNMVFRGIDIDLGGKAGAIGINMHAAQGSTIQDVNIDATGAFAGIQSLCGSGTIFGNIRVDGGRYAFYVTKNRPMATLVGITCIGQTVRAIHFQNNLAGPLTIVGFKIEASSGPVFNIDASTDDEHISLIDGSIELTGASATVIKNQDRSVYLRNVYVKNGNKIVDNVQGTDVIDNSGNWTHFDEYSFFHVTNRQLDNDVHGSGEFSRNLTIETASAPPADLISRHLWDESTFPHFEDGNCIFVDATGSDDQQTIQNAIDSANGKTVFLQKGDYFLDSQLIFEDDTKLIGVSRNLSRIRCEANWTESTFKTMIKTPANGTDATCLLAWLALDMPGQQSTKISTLDWTAGRHSMVREVNFRMKTQWTSIANGIKRIKVSGTGGGRWYGVYTRGASEAGEHPDHRQFLIENTTEPLSFYAFCVEYQESEVYMSEIKNCSNVSMYGFKCETDINNADGSGSNKDNRYKHTPALGIVNSTNIIVMGQGGHAELDPNESNAGLFEIAGASSDDIQIANATGGWGNNTNWGIVRDMYAGKVIKKNKLNGPGDPVALFSIGDPNPVVYTPAGDGSGVGGIGEIQEFASSIVEASSGDTEEWKANASASGGEFVIYKSNAIGDYIQFNSINVPSAGDYDIYVGLQKHSNGGKVQLQVNAQRTNLGSSIDTYAASASFQEIFFASKNFSSGGDKRFTFEVTGTSGSNHYMRLDYIKLVSTVGGEGSSPLYENDGSGSDPTTDFTNINGSHMNEFSYSGGKLDASSGWRRIKLTAADAANWTDYTVDVDVDNITNGGAKNVGLVLLRCGSGENYYGVFVDANNNILIGKKLGSWIWTSGGASGANVNSYSLSIDVYGSSTTNIDVYVNDNTSPAMTYSDSSNPHTTGGIGFENRGQHAAWDNIVVNE